MTAPVSTQPEPADPPESDALAPLAARLGLASSTVEVAIGGVLALAAIVLTAALARDMWFGSDELEYLTHRTAFDLGDLTRPIGGHWTSWSVLLLRGLYRTAGLDWWPWYILPRLIGHTLLVTFLWRVVRRRGADPLVGLALYATLLVLGASSYQRAVQIGNWVVYAVLIVCAWIIARRPEPTIRDRLVVAGALLVAVLGNGYAVAIIGGISLALLLARRLVVWLPSLVPALAIYLLWYLRFRDEIRPRPELRVGKVLDIPANAFRVLRTAVETATALPGWAAALVVVALLATIVGLVVRRRIDLFESMILCTLGVGLCLLSVQRISIESESADAVRYGYSVTILLSLALVPHIRVPPTLLARGVVLAVGCWLVVANVAALADGSEVRAENGRENLARYQVAAELMANGEPVVGGPSTIGGGLETDELRHLLDDGHEVPPLAGDDPDRAELERVVRGAFRMNLLDRIDRRVGFDALAGVPLETTSAVDEQSCVVVAEAEPVTATISDPGRLTFTRDPDQVLHLTWIDEYGEGELTVDQENLPTSSIALVKPDGSAEVRLTSDQGDITVCGFA